MFTLIRPGVRGPPQLLRVRVSQTGKETLGRKTNHGFLLGLFYKDYSISTDGQEENDWTVRVIWVILAFDFLFARVTQFPRTVKKVMTERSGSIWSNPCIRFFRRILPTFRGIFSGIFAEFAWRFFVLLILRGEKDACIDKLHLDDVFEYFLCRLVKIWWLLIQVFFIWVKLILVKMAL